MLLAGPSPHCGTRDCWADLTEGATVERVKHGNSWRNSRVGSFFLLRRYAIEEFSLAAVGEEGVLWESLRLGVSQGRRRIAVPSTSGFAD